VGSSISYLSRVSALARLLGYSALVAGLLALSGRTFLRNAIWADPVNLWREAVDKAPTDPLPRIVLGEVLHGAGRHPEAAESFQAALKLDPNEPLTYFKLSLCLTESGRSAEAIAALDRQRSIQPRSILVPTGLGVVALMTGDPERARNHFHQALETDPRNVLALQWLAVLEEGHGAPAEALRRCEEIQQIQPGKLSSEDCIRRNRLRLATESANGR
jgi:Flp pilus assembly protein TadD